MSDRLQIRAARPEELAWINRCYDEVAFMHSAFDNEVIAIAEVDEEKAGLGRLVTLDEKSAELGGMYVFEPFRGRGIAREIVAFLLGKALPLQTIYCIPFEHLTPFYMQCGFSPCTNREAVPPTLLKKYLWCKEKYPQPTSLLILTS